MNGYLLILLLTALSILQTTVLPRLITSDLRPDVMLLVVVGWALLRGPREGALWGFVGGIGLDVLSAAPFGLNTLLLTLIGFASGLGETRIFRTNFILPPLVAAGATLVLYLTSAAWLQLAGWPVDWIALLARLVLPSVGVNALIMPFVFLPLRWMSRVTGRAAIGV